MRKNYTTQNDKIAANRTVPLCSSLSAQNLLFHYTCYDSSLLHLRKNKINGKDYHRYQGVSG
jgi:hypothetical protein